MIPFEKDAGVFEVHQILIPRNGIHILENINTEEMVKDRLGNSCSRLARPASRAACRRSSTRSRLSELSKAVSRAHECIRDPGFSCRVSRVRNDFQFRFRPGFM